MRTEQKYEVLSRQNRGLCWLLLSLLLLAAQGATTPRVAAAQVEAEAESEAAEESKADSEESEEVEEKTPDKDPPADKQDDGKKQGTKQGDETEDTQKEPSDPPAEEKPSEEKTEEEKAKKTKDSPQKDSPQDKTKETKSDKSEKPSEEADPPADSKSETKEKSEPKPKADSPKEDPRITPKTSATPKQPEHPKKKKCIIGATAVLLEKQSEIQFRARVDSGAKSCSLHFEKIKIEDESKKENITELMTENIGKVIHFEIKNGNNKTHILTSKIAGYVIIKTSDKKEGKRRYKVPLTFRWKSMEKEVLVTLNKRNHMEYPLLLGRNFLKGDFLVDVELNSDD